MLNATLTQYSQHLRQDLIHFVLARFTFPIKRNNFICLVCYKEVTGMLLT